MSRDLTDAARRARDETPDSIRAAAELHMLDALGVPADLLPPALAGHPLLALSERIRFLCTRRARLLHRIGVAAAGIAARAGAIDAAVAAGHTPDAGLHGDDVDAVTAGLAVVRELDTVLADTTRALRAAAGEYHRCQDVPGVPLWWQ